MFGHPTNDPPLREDDRRPHDRNGQVDDHPSFLGRLLEWCGAIPSPAAILTQANLPTRIRQVLFVVLFLFALSAAIASWGNVKGILQTVGVLFVISLAAYALDRMIRSTDRYWKLMAKVVSSFALLLLLAVSMTTFLAIFGIVSPSTVPVLTAIYQPQRLPEESTVAPQVVRTTAPTLRATLRDSSDAGAVWEPLVDWAAVLDGDSLSIKGTRVRLHGVDAPELRQTCLAEGDSWPCGDAARSALDRRISGQVVECEAVDIDRYGRTLAKCYVADIDIGSWLVSEGWAFAYWKYSTDYLVQEQEAKAARRGIWRGHVLPPWDWRRGARLHTTDPTQSED